MKRELKTKWIEALRSGNYKQGTSHLRTIDDCYCCLGVLADVNKETWTVRKHNNVYEIQEMFGYSLPKNYEKMLSSEDQGSLMQMNDTDGYRFDEIADWIEANV